MTNTDVLAVVSAVRSRQPLVHCITATVSMGIVADGLLAAGARPMMTETVHEAPAVTGLADALLVNLGTLSTDAMEGIPATVAAFFMDDMNRFFRTEQWKIIDRLDRCWKRHPMRHMIFECFQTAFCPIDRQAITFIWKGKIDRVAKQSASIILDRCTVRIFNIDV